MAKSFSKIAYAKNIFGKQHNFNKDTIGNNDFNKNTTMNNDFDKKKSSCKLILNTNPKQYPLNYTSNLKNKL
jgi:hypothetical protein